MFLTKYEQKILRLVWLSLCFPPNHSQSLKGLGKLACVEMKKNIQGQSEQSSMTLIKIDFYGDIIGI